MAFFDKLGGLAKNIGDKTSDAIEINKLNSRINSEKAAAGEEMKKIGEFYYDFFSGGGAVAPEVLEFCRSAKAHFDAVEMAQSEIERIRSENEAPQAADPLPADAVPAAEAPPGGACPSCGAANMPGAKFCCECGAKLEAPPAVPVQPVCPGCGHPVAAGVKFCNECGTKIG